jgi:hypothetical protein
MSATETENNLAERRGVLLGRLMLLKTLFDADIPNEEQRIVDNLLGKLNENCRKL